MAKRQIPKPKASPQGATFALRASSREEPDFAKLRVKLTPLAEEDRHPILGLPYKQKACSLRLRPELHQWYEELSAAEKAEIIRLGTEGKTTGELAQLFYCTETTIDIVWIEDLMRRSKHPRGKARRSRKVPPGTRRRARRNK